MSAVVGIVHLDGAQALPRDLEVAVGALGFWPGGATTSSTDGACFGFVGASKGLPRAFLNGSAIITAAARLDNRDELCGWLEIAAHEQSNLSDASLVVRSFERWGEACPQRLNGDWSFAVWSPGKRQLFLARDHFGNTGLYYA